MVSAGDAAIHTNVCLVAIIYLPLYPVTFTKVSTGPGHLWLVLYIFPLFSVIPQLLSHLYASKIKYLPRKAFLVNGKHKSMSVCGYECCH